MSDVNIGNDEGGGPDYPPYREDFFQRIVNASWTPAAYAVAYFIEGSQFSGRHIAIRTEDGGKSWRIVFDTVVVEDASGQLSHGLGANNQLIFLMTCNTFIFRSVDTGKTWQTIGAPWPPVGTGSPYGFAGSAYDPRTGRFIMFSNFYSTPDNPTSRYVYMTSSDGVGWSQQTINESASEHIGRLDEAAVYPPSDPNNGNFVYYNGYACANYFTINNDVYATDSATFGRNGATVSKPLGYQTIGIGASSKICFAVGNDSVSTTDVTASDDFGVSWSTPISVTAFGVPSTAGIAGIAGAYYR